MKKILSVILSFVMLLSVTTGMTMTVHATTNKTQNEAVAWAEKQCGKSLDYDGSYGAQCVDLIMYYYKYLGKSIVGGNAKDYATNKLPSGWKRLKSNYSIQPGDIAVFKANVKNFTYEYGHIGIVHSGSNSKFTIIDQNSYEYGKKVAKHKESNYKTSNMLCVIRPDFKSEKSTIGFNANGGSGSMSGKTVSYNTTLTLPANSYTKGGYSFAGWNAYRSSDAKWYTNEGTWQTASSISNNGYTKKVYGNKWSGIFNNSWLSGKAKDTFTFYAIWKPTVSTFKFNSNGGSGTMSNVTVTTDTILTVPRNSFTKIGYSFAGWNAYRTSDAKWYTNEGTWQTASSISSNGYTKKVYVNNCSGIFNNSWLSGKEKDTFTLYATWNPNVLSVKHNANGGSVNSSSYYLNNNGTVCKYSTNTELTDPWKYNETHTYGLCNASTFGLYKPGYIFKGWTTYDNGIQTFSDEDSTVTASKINKNIINGNCTTMLYAMWEKEDCSHSFTSEITKKPSCGETGVNTLTCSLCGYIKTALVPATEEHTLGKGIVTKKPTYTATGVKTYKCTVCGKVLKTETLAKLPKKANTLVAKGKTATVKFANLKKKNQTVLQKNAFTVSKAQGKVTYKKASGNGKITVNSAGKFTVKKGLKKGTYKIKVKVTAAGNTTYKAVTKTVTVTIKVK